MDIRQFILIMVVAIIAVVALKINLDKRYLCNKGGGVFVNNGVCIDKKAVIK